MIRNIKLENFRGFQDEIAVRIRPITVLIGQNSAGKSSLLKFLLMLRQTLESKGSEFFVTEGRQVRLGTWRDLRNSNSKQQRFINPYFRYSIEMETVDLPSAEIRALWESASRQHVVKATADAINLSVSVPNMPPRAKLEQGQFTISGRMLYGRRWSRGTHEVRGAIEGKPVFLRRTSHLQNSRFLEFGQQSERISDAIFDVATDRFLDGLRQEFLQIEHLSPIREESEEVIQTGSPPPGEVGHKGEYAMPHLARIFSDGGESAKADLITRYMERVARVDRLQFRKYASQLLTRVRGRNMDTRAVCELTNFGFGVGQCIPIFVQGALNQRNQLLLVEQPEAQLHPTAQLELASFFADLWRKRNVPSIVETHSSNILLRLRLLVKQSKLSPSDISVAYFHIKGVSAKRVPRHPAIVVDNLAIDEKGGIVGDLPMEFFGADVIEALDLGSERAD